MHPMTMAASGSAGSGVGLAGFPQQTVRAPEAPSAADIIRELSSILSNVRSQLGGCLYQAACIAQDNLPQPGGQPDTLRGYLDGALYDAREVNRLTEALRRELFLQQ
jgi:hypothetical protein